MQDLFEQAKYFFQEGLGHLKLGNLDQAEHFLLKSLEIIPDRASTKNNLAIVNAEKANLAIKKGDFNEAIDLYQEAIQYNPSHASNWLNLGNIYFEHLNNPKMAIEYFKKALTFNQNYLDAHFNLANVYTTLEDFPKALKSLDETTRIDNNFSDAWLNKGIILNLLNRHPEALECLNKCLEIQPNWSEALTNKGLTLTQLKMYEDAISSYDQAIISNPNNADARSNKGACLYALMRYDEALSNYNHAIKINPNSAIFWFNRGACLRALNFPKEAIINYDKALLIDPLYTQALINKGATFFEIGYHEEAIINYEKAININPNIGFAYGDYLHAQMSICKHHSYEQLKQNIVSKISDLEPIIQPLHLLAIEDDPKLQLECSKIFVKENYHSNQKPQTHRARQKSKIKIAYISPDFGNHPITHLISEVIESHDHNHFETHGIYFGNNPKDLFYKRISSAFDQFHDVNSNTELEIFELVRSLEIDIAVDLAGHTRNSRTQLFANRCAPIQINFLGFPGTMGCEFIDYIIADEILITEKELSFFSEKPIYMPRCFQPNDSKRRMSQNTPTRISEGLPDDKFIFCCFNNSYKLTPGIFKKWAKILLTASNSVLWITADNKTSKENILSEFEKENISSDRIFFSSRVNYLEYLAKYKLADLFLDTLPFNAGTTASDALWAGLPVLTQTGKSFAGRMATSLLHHLNLNELICKSDEEYILKAIELAENPEQINRIKRNLNNTKDSNELFNGKIYAQNLEKVFTEIYTRHQNGLPPTIIRIK